MGGFKSALRAEFSTITPLVIWVFLTVVVGLAGPFGTYPTFGLAHRLLFWSVDIGLCIVAGGIARACIYGTLLGRSDTLVGAILVAMLLALVLPFAIFGSIAVLLGPAYQHAPQHLELTVFVFCTSLGISAYRAVTGSSASGQAVATRTPGIVPPMPVDKPELGAPPPRLIRRLPPDQRCALISLSVRDHYVDVTTDCGRASLLLRLSDAVEEADGVDGAQVHRSHWVAWAAVMGTDHGRGKLRLVMRDGSHVPVSKPYRALVEARGFGIARAAPPPVRMARAPAPNNPSNAASSAQSPPV